MIGGRAWDGGEEREIITHTFKKEEIA